MPKTPVSILLPLPSGLKITAICESSDSPGGVLVHVSSTRRRARCPMCWKPSRHVHSRYSRRPADLPCIGRPIRLVLSVRKFFCKVLSCPRKIFAERLTDLLEPSSRLTTRLRTTLQQVGLGCGGKRGERLSTSLGMGISDTTILWSVQLLRTPTVEINQVRVVGIDDWSWRRGQRYGTIIVDLERQQVLDLLPDRNVESVRAWLADHPQIEVVSRDRGGNYVDGASQGAPQAIQVADRWHLYANLGEAVERFLVRSHIRVPDALPDATASQPGNSSPEDFANLTNPVTPSIRSSISTSTRPRRLQRSQASLVRRWEQHQQIHLLRSQGLSLHQITRDIGLARNTVRKYARQPVPPSAPEPTSRPRRNSVLDPYEGYLQRRWNEGCRNAALLFRDIKEQGYPGGKTTVKDYISYLRRYPSEAYVPHSRKNRAASTSPRELRWLLARQKEDLDKEQQAKLERLLEASTEVQRVHALLQNFHVMMKQKREEMLDCWLEQADKSGITEIRSFAYGVRRDYSAVKAAIVLPWSQGQTEGQVNKLKTLKRAMYGRAGFDLLRQRMLSSGG
jgi:transposase